MYSVIFVDGWDIRAGEAIGGGRCLEELPTRAAALDAASQWAGMARRLFGLGLVAVTSPEHELEALLHPHCDLVREEVGELVAA